MGFSSAISLLALLIHRSPDCQSLSTYRQHNCAISSSLFFSCSMHSFFDKLNSDWYLTEVSALTLCESVKDFKWLFFSSGHFIQTINSRLHSPSLLEGVTSFLTTINLHISLVWWLCKNLATLFFCLFCFVLFFNRATF